MRSAYVLLAAACVLLVGLRPAEGYCETCPYWESAYNPNLPVGCSTTPIFCNIFQNCCGRGEDPDKIRTGGCFCDDACRQFDDCCPEAYQYCLSIVIDSITPATPIATTGQRITIVGAELDSANLNITVGGKECVIDAATQSLTSVECDAPEHSGGPIDVVAVDAPFSKTSNTYSWAGYRAPTVSVSSPSSIDTDGGTLYSINGNDFGPKGNVLMGSGSLTPVPDGNFVTRDHTTLEFYPLEGEGASVTVRVSTASGQSDIPTGYSAPSVSAVSKPLSDTRGNDTMWVIGENFGSPSANITILLGLFPVDVITWNHTHVQVTIPEGQGQLLAVDIDVSGLSSLSTPLFGYYRPEVEYITPGSGGTEGGYNISIVGANFGISQQTVFIEGTPCDIQTVNHTQIVCTVRPGQGINRPVTVTVTGQSNIPLPVAQFDFDAPSVDWVAPAGPTLGGTNITVAGSNFGQSSSVTVDGNPCTVQWQNHTQIICLLPAGQGTVDVFVTVSAQTSNAGTYSYQPPQITGASPQRLGTVGGATIILEGQNFGTSGVVTFGGQFDCPATGSGFSHTTIECLVPEGYGANVSIEVDISGLTDTSTEYFSYRLPNVTALQVSAGAPTSGGGNLVLIGTNMGAVAGRVTVDGKNCTISTQGHEAVECSMPEGRGDAAVLYWLGGQQSVNPPLFVTYDGPFIDTVTPSSGPTAGGTNLVIDGSSFDTFGNITVGGRNCTVTSWSHTRVRCDTGEGQGEALDTVIVTRGGANMTKPNSFSYSAPSISLISITFSPTVGGDTLVINGTNLGLGDQPGDIILIGAVECPRVNGTWDHFSVQCIIPPGQGTGLLVRVVVGGQQSNSRTFGYSAPFISTVGGQLGPTQGNTTVMLTGSNFGTSPVITLQGIGECVLINSSATHDKAFCRLPEGSGLSRFVRVNAGGQLSNSKSYDYGAPEILGLHAPDGLKTAGGVNITFTGRNFGLASSVTVGGKVCAVQSQNHFNITCILPDGEGENLDVEVVVATQPSNLFQMSYDAPVVLAVDPGTGATAGGYRVNVTGENFGTSGSAKIGGQTCTSPSGSHTRLECTVPAGIGKDLPVEVSVLGRSSTQTANFSYSPPVITGVSPSLDETNGGSTIQLFGRSLGSAGTVTVYGADSTGGVCSSTGPAFAHTSITCVLPFGQGKNVTIEVDVAGQIGNTTLFSYRPPNVVSVSSFDGFPPAGAVDITLSGDSFGSVGSAFVDFSGTKVDCPVEPGSHFHNQLVCELPAALEATGSLVLNISGQLSAGYLITYDGPSLFGVLPATGPTSGTINITVSGEDFGSGGNVTIGGLPCPNVQFSDTQIICTLPEGQGADLDVDVVVEPVGGSASLLAGFSYDAPTLAAISADSDDTSGGGTLTLDGSNFGVNATVYFGETTCQPAAPQTHQQFLCEIPAGDGNVLVSIDAGGQVSNQRVFVYGAPDLYEVTPTSAPTTGGTNLTLTGLNFGLNGTVTVGSAPCPVVWRNVTHRSLICTLPAGVGQNLDVYVTVAEQDSPYLQFSYDGPELYSLYPPFGPTNGDGILQLNGSNFGDAAAGTVSVGGFDCPVQYWSNFNVTCNLPVGSGLDNVVFLSVGGQSSNSLYFNYTAPNITAWEPKSAPSGGGVTLTLNGTNFGTSATVKLGGVSCSLQGSVLDHRQILCSSPAGFGTQDLVVTVNGQQSPARSFTYEAPSISSVTVSGGAPTSGGPTLTISGSSFTTGGFVTVGDSNATCAILPSGWSHSLIKCQLPAGQGTDQRVYVHTQAPQSRISNYETLSYIPPFISSISPGSSGTKGGGVLVVEGSNFGLSGTVYVGAQVCPETGAGWGHARIECSIPTGAGAVNVRVVTGGQTSNTKPFTYNLPTLVSVTGASGTAGGNATITGTNFGNNASWAALIITGVTPDVYLCNATSAHHTVFFCEFPSGVGAGHTVQVKVRGQVSNTLPFAFDPPVVANVTGCPVQDGPVTKRCPIGSGGSQNVTITGANFGPASAPTANVTLGGVHCTDVEYISHSQLLCVLPDQPTGGLLLQVSVSAGGQSNGPANFLSYAGPEFIDGTLRLTASPGPASEWGSVNISDSSAQVNVTFQGLDVGVDVNAINVTCGPAGAEDTYPCHVVSLVGSNITCTTTQQYGLQMFLQMTVGLQVSSASNDYITTDRPFISNGTIRSPGGTPFSSFQGVSTEGENIEFEGGNFGTDPAAITVMFGPEGGPYDTECVVQSAAHTSLICNTPPGEDGPYVFQVTVGGRTSEPGTDEYNYPTAPVLYKVTGCSGTEGNATSGCPTEGGTTLTLTGTDFPNNANETAVIRVGIKNCPITKVTLPSEIECSLPPGQGVNLDVYIVAGAFFSRSLPLVSYAAPQLTAITGCVNDGTEAVEDCARSGGDVVTLDGSDFGESGALVLVGPNECDDVQHDATTPHSRLTCTVPAGTGIGLAVINIQNGGLASNNSMQLSYLLCQKGYRQTQGVACATCLPGTFTSASGLFVCTECVPGQYNNANASTTCTKCGFGTYSKGGSGAAGSTECLDCSPGTYAPFQGMDECQPCVVGKIAAGSAAQECESCPAGKHAPAPGASACLGCEPGEFAATPGSFSCPSCSPGFFSNQTNATECLACAPGSFQGSAGATQCIDCAAGKAIVSFGAAACEVCASGRYAAGAGFTSCVQCPAGEFSQQNLGDGPTECTPCPAGEYASGEGNAACLPCDQGSVSNDTGFASCVQCAPGYFAATVGLSVCSECPVGRAAVGFGSDACAVCPPGKAAAAGSSSCSDCPAGEFSAASESPSCTECSSGRYNPNSGLTTCVNCPDGQFGNRTGLTVCDKCTSGSFSKKAVLDLTGPTTCSLCAAGSAVGVLGADECPLCLPGYFATNNGSEVCDRCPVGFRTLPPHTGQTSCAACSPGSFSNILGAVSCTDCAAGSVMPAENATACTPCPVGSFRFNPGGEICEFCPTGRAASGTGFAVCTVCPAGTRSSPSNDSCIDCAPGTFQGAAESSTCLECPMGKFTPASAQVACVDCVAGEIANVSGLTGCVPCPPGTISELPGGQECVECPTGKFAPNSGSFICQDAPPGEFVGETGSEVSSPCPAGFFQSAPGEDACQPCPLGTFADIGGLSACVDCPLGMYAGALNQSQCDLCPPGKTSGTGAAACTNCTVGRFAVSAGSVSCAPCPEGSAQDTPGRSSCDPCEPGYKQGSQGQATCQPCAEGTFSAAFGQADCLACAAGTAANESASSVCARCPVGRFSTQISPTEGAHNCTVCPAGSVQPAEAQGSCLDCPAGFFIEETGGSLCSPCARGTFAVAAGSSACTNCSAGRSAVNTGSLSCDSCDLGKHTPGPGFQTCIDCPEGKYQDSAEASVCLDCQTGRFASLPGAPACTECPAGSFSNETAQEACIECQPGRASGSAGLTACGLCAPGSFVATAGAFACSPCAPGEISAGFGTKVCQKCPAGTQGSNGVSCQNCTTGKFAASEGSFSCTDCQTGKFAGSPGQQVCTDCPAGTYGGLTQLSVCSQCETGRFAQSVGTTACSDCPVGKAQSAVGQVRCDGCAPGSAASTEGSVTCDPCLPGSVAAGTGSLECELCPVGTISNDTGASSCTGCPAGSFNGAAGSSVCSECTTGRFSQFSSQLACDRCPNGEFSNTTGSTACLRCAAGRFSAVAGPGGASGCTDCSAGSSQPAVGQGSCFSCAVGRFSSSSGAVVCDACVPGYYAPSPSASVCLECPLGQFAAGTETAACALCLPGSFANDTGSTSCSPCESGTSQPDAGQGLCVSCSIGRASTSQGRALCDPCDPGTFSNITAAEACRKCPRGKYSPQSEATACIPCSPGSFISVPGQASCALCPVGKYNNDSSQTFCDLCAVGFYQDQPGQLECLECPVGRFADAQGQFLCSECAAGSFQNDTGSIDCRECTFGKFQTDPGKSRCLECVPGRFAQGTGSVQCPACPAGRFTEDNGTLTCDKCDFGEFQDTPGATGCQACPVGRYGDVQELKVCKLCPSGQANNLTNQLSCTDCVEGKFMAFEGADYCDECELGKFTDVQGRQSCQPCPTGSFSNVTGAKLCPGCQPGRYTAAQGSVNCTACEIGRFAQSPGLDVCAECFEGSFANVTGLVNCLPCGPGTQQPDQGATVCEQCPNGTASVFDSVATCPACPQGRFMNGTGALVCDQCARGYVQPLVGQTACVQCTLGKYAEQKGQPVCESCDPGTFANISGLSACQLCAAGRFVSDVDQTVCVDCPVGTQQPSAGQASCEQCPIGRFSNDNGTLFCDPCPRGRYEDNAECKDCPIGRATNVSATASCGLCLSGKYQPNNGSFFCTSCPIGSAQPAFGALNCTVCGLGRFSHSPGLEDCVDCPTGQYQNITNASSCVECGEGFYGPAEAGTQCYECQPGRFNPISGAEECRSCPYGRFTNVSSTVSCTLCQKGRFSANDTGAVACEECPIGRAVDVQGVAACSACAGGRYTNTTGNRQCEFCPPGKSVNAPGSTVCTNCTIGRFASTIGLRVCPACPVGKFGNATAASACENCPAGYFNSDPSGVTHCLICPVGTFAAGGAFTCAECPERQFNPNEGAGFCQECQDQNSVPNVLKTGCICDVGFYGQSLTHSPGADDYCAACPNGGDCTQQGTTDTNIGALAGFWRGSTDSLNFQFCLDLRNCEGGYNSTCDAHREGPLCANCVEGYYKGMGDDCQECPAHEAAVIGLIIAAIALVAFLILQFYILLRQGAPLMRKAKRLDLQKDEGEEDFDFVDPEELAYRPKDLPPHTPPPPRPSLMYKLKIALGFLQIMSNLSFSIDVPWPVGYRRFVSLFTIINLDVVRISSVECVFETNYYRKFFFIAGTPIFIFLIIFVVYLLPKYIGCGCYDNSASAKKRSRRRFWRMFTFGLFLIFPTVASTVVRFFICKDVDQMGSWLVADMRVSCDTDDYGNFKYVAIPAVIIYPVGIPAFLFYMIFKYRHRLAEPGVEAQLGFFYGGFFHEFWWFEVADMLHKLTLVSLLAFLPVEFQLGVGMSVAILYAIVILVLRPYIRKGDDRLHLLAQTEIFLLLLAAMVFDLDKEFDPTVDAFLSFIFISLILVFGAFLVPQLVMIIIKTCCIKCDCIGRPCAKCSKKVAKWRAPAQKLTVEEIQNLQKRARREREGSATNILQVRNPLYQATGQAGHMTEKVGELTLVANPLFQGAPVDQWAKEEKQIALNLQDDAKGPARMDDEVSSDSRPDMIRARMSDESGSDRRPAYQFSSDEDSKDSFARGVSSSEHLREDFEEDEAASDGTAESGSDSPAFATGDVPDFVKPVERDRGVTLAGIDLDIADELMVDDRVRSPRDAEDPSSADGSSSVAYADVSDGDVGGDDDGPEVNAAVDSLDLAYDMDGFDVGSGRPRRKTKAL